MSKTYILIIESKNNIYSTFWQTIHFHAEKDKNNEDSDFNHELRNEAKVCAMNILLNPFHNHCLVKSLLIDKNTDNDYIFKLLSLIDKEGFYSENVKNFIK